MPEIAYTITAELTVDTIRQWAELDIYPDTFIRSPAEMKIKACRQWVAENPEYPDGTIVVAEINGSTAVLEQVEGEWWYAHTVEALGGTFLKSGTPPVVVEPVVVVRVLHTPPTMRDHLHAIGLNNDRIKTIALCGGGVTVAGLGGGVQLLGSEDTATVRNACQEAERD